MSWKRESTIDTKQWGKDTSIEPNKYYYMKQFIDAASAYLRIRNEDSGSLIKRHLQILCVSIDISIFDPNTSIVCEFFVSLHELLSNLEPRSVLVWFGVEVLGVACKNNAARHQLIHTYEFIPVLSRLVYDSLSSDKKIRLLTVMQELTYGIKISWQIPHLHQLISTLTNWIIKNDARNNNQDEQITVLSLGVLVNLCYNNFPGVYTLSRCVDIKTFLRHCSKLKDGSKMEMNIVKLIIILEYDCGSIPGDTFLKLINVTFKTLCEAFTAQDSILLRHIVDFFLDVKKQNEKSNANFREIMLKYENYDEEVEQLLKVMKIDCSDSQQNPDCISSIFRFLIALIEMNLPKIDHLNFALAKWSLNWINDENASSEAINMLRIILTNSNYEHQLCELLLSALTIFLSNLQNFESNTDMNIECCNRLSSVLQLIRALVLAESTRNHVLIDLKIDLLNNIFASTLGGSNNNSTPEIHALLVNALFLVYELSKYKQEWLTHLSSILERREIQAILAHCLYSSNPETKALILQMAAFQQFPSKQISNYIYELQPALDTEKKINAVSSIEYNLRSPTLSIIQAEKLDEALDHIKRAHAENQFANTSTSNVIELYEFKLIAMGHAERASRASIDHASQHCMHLQHQVVQLTAEVAKTRQLFIKFQQSCEELEIRNKSQEKNIQDLNNKHDSEKGKVNVYKSEIEKLEKVLQEKEKLITEYEGQVKEMKESNKSKDDNLCHLNDLVQKLKENLHKQERNSEKKDEVIKGNNSTIANLKTGMANMKTVVHQLGEEVNVKDAEIKENCDQLKCLEKELAEKTDLINTITRLTTKK